MSESVLTASMAAAVLPRAADMFELAGDHAGAARAWLVPEMGF